MARIFKMIPALIFLNFEMFVLTCCFEIIAALPETLEHSSDFSGRFLMSWYFEIGQMFLNNLLDNDGLGQ